MTEQDAAKTIIKNSDGTQHNATQMTVILMFACWYHDGTFDILCEETELKIDGSDLFDVIRDLQSIAMNEMEVKDVMYIGLA